MARRPRLLDLFCGEGGAAVGYAAAGFDVVGVDIEARPNYPFEFIRWDAFRALRAIGHLFDAIHAAPLWYRQSAQAMAAGSHLSHPDQLAEIRAALSEVQKPWVLEQATLSRGDGLLFCGASFGLQIIKHMWFSSNVEMLVPPCWRRGWHLCSVRARLVVGSLEARLETCSA